MVLRGAALQGQAVASAAQGFSGQGRDHFRPRIYRRLRSHLGQAKGPARRSSLQSELRLRLLWLQDGALWRRARLRRGSGQARSHAYALGGELQKHYDRDSQQGWTARDAYPSQPGKRFSEQTTLQDSPDRHVHAAHGKRVAGGAARTCEAAWRGKRGYRSDAGQYLLGARKGERGFESFA